jgi:hypothetical protein
MNISVNISLTIQNLSMRQINMELWSRKLTRHQKSRKDDEPAREDGETRVDHVVKILPVQSGSIERHDRVEQIRLLPERAVICDSQLYPGSCVTYDRCLRNRFTSLHQSGNGDTRCFWSVLWDGKFTSFINTLKRWTKLLGSMILLRKRDARMEVRELVNDEGGLMTLMIWPLAHVCFESTRPQSDRFQMTVM